jgi:hypothetical protein
MNENQSNIRKGGDTMITPSELYRRVSADKLITREIVDVLKELDTTSSTATQASLNNMLIELRTRVSNGEDIQIEDEESFNTIDDFDAWVQNNFEEYSVQMYMGSI